MSAVITIPVLPCISLPETVAFYGILGFEVTHQQTTPNVYAAMRRGEVNLHFMGIKGLDPAKAYSTCLVIVPEVEGLHQTFADDLRQAVGGPVRVADLGQFMRREDQPGNVRYL